MRRAIPPPRARDHAPEECPRCGVETIGGSICFECIDAEEHDRADSYEPEAWVT
jgi:hypothetical protein